MSDIGYDLTVNEEEASFALGTIISVTDNGQTKKYKYVQYEAGAAAVAGVANEVAYYANVATGDATGTIVTSDLSDSDEIGAGVLQAALTDEYYGWIQVAGLATLAGAFTAGTDGDNLTPTGAGDGNLDLVTAATDDICAVAIDASAFVIMCKFAH